MNISSKFVALSAVAGLASVSLAADPFRFFFAYGDAGTAALNGSTVGAPVNPAAAMRIPRANAANNTFKLQVWVEKLAGEPTSRYTAVSTLVAFDRAVAANAGHVNQSLFQHNKIKPFGNVTGSGLAPITWAGAISSRASLPAFDANGNAAGTGTIGEFVQLRGNFVNAPTASMRKVGYGVQSPFVNELGSPVGFRANINQAIRIYDLTFISNLQDGSYGYGSDETGLELWANTGTQQQAGAMSYVNGAGGHVGTRLNVTVVPEPNGLLALALGALALRRKKQR